MRLLRVEKPKRESSDNKKDFQKENGHCKEKKKWKDMIVETKNIISSIRDKYNISICAFPIRQGLCSFDLPACFQKMPGLLTVKPAN